MTEAAPVFLDVILRPSQPLSARAMVLVLIAVGFANFALGALFVAEGAWPVMPFMGLDVALLVWAFRASRKAARAHEHVVLTEHELVIARVPHQGEPVEVRLNPYWLNVRLEEDMEQTRHLYLSSHGRSTEIGRFLPPDERVALAERLKAALYAAKTHRPG